MSNWIVVENYMEPTALQKNQEFATFISDTNNNINNNSKMTVHRSRKSDQKQSNCVFD